MFRGISLKAVLLGVLIDWAMSLLVGMVIGIVVVIYAVAELHIAPTDSAKIKELLHSDWNCALVCVVGGVTTIIPGIATGWIARSNRVKNAFVMTIVSTLASLVMLPLMRGDRGPAFGPKRV
jgi:hypothetical protein